MLTVIYLVKHDIATYTLDTRNIVSRSRRKSFGLVINILYSKLNTSAFRLWGNVEVCGRFY